ncbi:hypothetical protein CPB83DRAFT_853529 [Crepidotus variabilis]|uniref:Uncharacterized protein n=1 Tax=Crepidotus variabilis TaxID=179855 RepID=A0A9P6EHV4_9AGAR|nr:hypothetical protein CPB83DRAFT_853529 [Crepidotus variabilis]
MIAKFHSAPGHSMETTLTINIPAPDRLRGAKSDKPKEKQKDTIKEEDIGGREKDDERLKKDDKEQKEREKLERERRALAEKGISHKDKFQKMREKYDKVTTTHETSLQELDVLNAKIKKLQSENDLLLDAMFLADTALYNRYFPPGPDNGPPIGYPPAPPPSLLSSHQPTHRHEHPDHERHLAPPMMATSSSSSSVTRFVDQNTVAPSRSSHQHVHNDHNGSHRQHREHREPGSKPHPFYVYPPREPVRGEPGYHESRSHRSHRGQHPQHPVDVYPNLPPQHHPMAPPRRIRSPAYEMELGLRFQDLLDRRGKLAPEEDMELQELLALNPPPTLPNSGGHLPPPRYNHSMPMPPPSPNGYPHEGRGQLPPPPVHDRHSTRATRSSRSSRSSSRRARPEDIEIDMHHRDYDAETDMSLGGPVHLDVDASGRTPTHSPNQARSGPHSYPIPGSVSSRPMAALEPPEEAMPPPGSGYLSHRSWRPPGRNGTGASIPITNDSNTEAEENDRHPRRRTSDLDIVMSEDEGSLGGPSIPTSGERVEVEHRRGRSRQESA